MRANYEFVQQHDRALLLCNIRWQLFFPHWRECKMLVKYRFWTTGKNRMRSVIHVLLRWITNFFLSSMELCRTVVGKSSIRVFTYIELWCALVLVVKRPMQSIKSTGIKLPLYWKSTNKAVISHNSCLVEMILGKCGSLLIPLLVLKKNLCGPRETIWPYQIKLHKQSRSHVQYIQHLLCLSWTAINKQNSSPSSPYISSKS